MPHDCAARLFSECLCPHTSSVTKAKVLPSPDIPMWKVKFVKRDCQSPLICVSVVMFNLLLGYESQRETTGCVFVLIYHMNSGLVVSCGRLIHIVMNLSKILNRYIAVIM